MAAWTDAHNHLQDPRLGDAAPVIAAMRAAGVERCVVNAIREEDWQNVAALADAHPGFIFPAFGIHPWHAHTATPGWQERLAAILTKHPHATIGECGLDQWISSPCIGIQRGVFRDHLLLGREMNRAVTIHCLKAWGPLFDAFAEETPPPRFLMHSFGGSIEIARRLVPLGAFFSFSGHFLHEKKSAILDVFRKLPHDRILLETDAPDMLPPDRFITHPLPEKRNHPANLPAIGTALAEALAMTPGELARLTSANTARCFAF
jgi:TatD DNase family protein